MATIDWPDALAPQSSEFSVAYNDMAFTSVFSNAQQIVSFPGDYWQLSMTLPPLGRDKERLLVAKIGQLRGRVNWFRFRDRRYRHTLGDVGSPIVDGGGQTGVRLQTRLWTPSITVLRAGDYITVADQMFQMVEDVVSDADGNALLPLNMWIRSSPDSAAPVEYQSPYCVMRLASSTNPIKRQVGRAGITIQAREAF
ncbi:hypothetical protein P3W43_01510 [Salinicola salarius]|uniref:hypothetical protein n=1 Tax=Salinicola salarius TaxID=430457 RepID=UPI0023E461A2|nr:hypothetical protein [Salinicola salarius]MDF3917526.1 hypothetical protein [Salinicola salarius]